MMKKNLFILFSAIVLLSSPVKAWVGEYELDHEMRVTRTPKGIRAQVDGVNYNVGKGIHLKKGANFGGQRLPKDLNLDVNMTPLQFRKELSKFGEITDVKMSIQEEPAVAKKKPAVAKKKPAVAKKKLAVAKKKPAVAKKKPALAKKKPAVTKKKPAVTKKKPAVTKKKPAVTKKKPIVVKKKPIVVKKKPVVTKKRAAVAKRKRSRR